MMNPYELLGLGKDSSTAEVRKSFRRLSKKHHPDAGGNPEKFRELTLAADILSDPIRRKRYDETGRVEEPRVTPQRVKAFLRNTFEGVIAANDDIATVDVQDKLIRSIKNGMMQAHAQKEDTERKIRRAEGLRKRFVKKNGDDGIVAEIMTSKIEELLKELQNVNDAIELAETAINMLETYKYSVDPAPEGPLSAGPTFAPRYGGRSSTGTWVP